MNVSYNWLKEYIDFELSPEELVEELTHAGLEANLVEQYPDYYRDIKIGKILSKSPHPDADKLSVCQVDLGEEESFQIICGAPNVAEGQTVAVATIGTTFPDGLKIKKAKLRGVLSHGMICSERELELSDNHDGIMVLDDGARAGNDFTSYLTGNDVAIELDLTPDRSYALGHIGVARDLAALLDKPLNIPEIHLKEGEQTTAELVSVELEDAEACPRYATRLVKNIKIDDSPAWLRQRLQAAGVRSINNVVDAANYVLMETGHPLHTFDLRYIEDSKIIVRRAKDKEKITTLDGKERELDEQVLLICDGQKPVAVAGIMGGENSEVKDDTTDLLLESAYFNPVVVRRGARKLQLSTDASHRFERGVDPNGVVYALDRLAALIVELAGGEISQGRVDAYPDPIKPLVVEFRPHRCNRVLGTDIAPQEMVRILTNLGMEVSGTDTMAVTVPTFRPDIEREIDIIEEVARIHGFDKIPVPEHFSIANKVAPESPDKERDKVVDQLAAIGFHQVYGNSLVGADEHPQFFGDEAPLVLANPLSQDMATMRSSLLRGLEKVILYNLNRRQENLRIFEIGQVSNTDSVADTGALERTHLALFMAGMAQSKQWMSEAEPVSIFHMKGILESVFKGLFKLTLTFAATEHAILNNALSISLNGEQIGFLGELTQSDEKRKLGIYAEIVFSKKMVKSPPVKYAAVPQYPSVERDLSILIDKAIAHDEIEKLIGENAGKYLIYSRLYDIYEGKSIASGKKSLTFRLVFQNSKRTLTEKEIDKDFSRVLRGLENAFNATLREASHE